MKEIMNLECNECGVSFKHEIEHKSNNFSKKDASDVKELVERRKLIKDKINNANASGLTSEVPELEVLLEDINSTLRTKYLIAPDHIPNRCPECREKKKQERRDNHIIR